MTVQYSGMSTRDNKMGGKEFVAIFSTENTPSVEAGSIKNAFAHAAVRPTIKAGGLIYWNTAQIEANLGRYTDSAEELKKGMRGIKQKENNATAASVRKHSALST